MEAKELAEAYRQLFKSAIGKDIMERLNTLYQEQLDTATKSEKDLAWSLLSKAAGIDLIRSEFNRLQSIDRRGEGR